MCVKKCIFKFDNYDLQLKKIKHFPIYWNKPNAKKEKSNEASAAVESTSKMEQTVPFKDKG